jgi:Uma2 family endonuclease
VDGSLTLDEFLARPLGDPPEEYRDGTAVPKPALAAPERWLRSDLATLLFGWARASQQGAVAATTPCAFAGAVYVPDVVYFVPGRLDALATAAGSAIRLPPDLAVDVCPSAVDPAWFAARANELLAGGVRQAWVVDAGAETVTVFAAGAEPRVLGRDAVLEAPALLPSFYVHLDDLFEVLAEEAAEASE